MLAGYEIKLLQSCCHNLIALFHSSIKGNDVKLPKSYL